MLLLGTSLNFSSTGAPLVINGATANNGNLTLVNATGSLSVAASGGVNAVISATNGNITLQNTNTTNGSISIGANSTIHASATAAGVGNVNIVIGAIPSNPVVGTTPSNVTVNDTSGGVTYFGTNGITASAPTNTLNGSGRNIIFSTGSLSASAIHLGGSVTITADPPPLSGTGTATNSANPSNIAPIQLFGQNFMPTNNSILIVQPTSANTAGICNASVQSLNNDAAADTFALDKR